MAERRIFPVPVRRAVDAARVAPVPPLDEAQDESGFEWNRDYHDLRGLDWQDVAHALAEEKALIARLEAAEDLEEESESIDEERLEAVPDPLWGLDVGVATAVLALSAMGCVPFASCSAGAFGGRHSASHPVIAFYLRSDLVEPLLALAAEAEAGLVVDEYGRARLYAGDAARLVAFAEGALRLQPS